MLFSNDIGINDIGYLCLNHCLDDEISIYFVKITTRL